jgi:hypothetical protein
VFDPVLALVLVLLVLLGLWALLRGYGRRPAGSRPGGDLGGQSLAALAQPDRGLMAEALEIERDVRRQVAAAPRPLRGRLAEIEARIGRLIAAALPQARQGTMLAAYLLRLSKDEPVHAETQATAGAVEEELKAFVTGLRSLRAKVYGVLTGAARLGPSGGLQDELEDALFELDALEAAFREVREVT